MRGWELACAPAQGTFISGYSTALNASGASDPVTVNLYDDDVTVCVCTYTCTTHTLLPPPPRHGCIHTHICIYGFSGMMCRESNYDFCKRIIIFIIIIIITTLRDKLLHDMVYDRRRRRSGTSYIDAYLAYPYHTSFGRVVV